MTHLNHKPWQQGNQEAENWLSSLFLTSAFVSAERQPHLFSIAQLVFLLVLRRTCTRKSRQNILERKMNTEVLANGMRQPSTLK
eukprot:g45241.t1